MKYLLALCLLCSTAYAQTNSIPKTSSTQIVVDSFDDPVTSRRGLPVLDFKSQVAAGNIRGYSIMKGMGEYESGGTDAAGEDVCRWQDFTPDGPTRLPTPSLAGEQMTLISESAEDGAGTSTGVLTVRVHYLDVAGKEQTEDVTLNGTTGANTTFTNAIFINDLYALTVGSNGVAVGNIAIYKLGGSIASDLYNMIGAGGNKSLVPHRMVPANKTLLLQEWCCTEAQSKRAAFRIRSTDMHGVLISGVFCFKGVSYLNGGASGTMALTARVPEFSVVKVTVWADAVASEGSCDWWGYLIDDANVKN